MSMCFTLRLTIFRYELMTAVFYAFLHVFSTQSDVLVACERRRISGCRLSPEIRLRSQANVLDKEKVKGNV